METLLSLNMEFSVEKFGEEMLNLERNVKVHGNSFSFTGSIYVTTYTGKTGVSELHIFCAKRTMNMLFL